MRKLKLRTGPSFTDRVRKSFNNQTLNKLNMENLELEKKLKHFQLALSMVGVSANLMTCELIKELSAAVDAKGSAFNLGDAEKLAEAIQQKYQAMGPPMGMPPGMMPPAN